MDAYKTAFRFLSERKRLHLLFPFLSLLSSTSPPQTQGNIFLRNVSIRGLCSAKLQCSLFIPLINRPMQGFWHSWHFSTWRFLLFQLIWVHSWWFSQTTRLQSLSHWLLSLKQALITLCIRDSLSVSVLFRYHPPDAPKTPLLPRL